MAEVTASMVKSIRQRTGAGMMDCKNALVETGGDEEKAVEIIQKKGLARVAKKAGAIAAEGLVQSYIHAGSRIGVLVEVNCQTDFVARNEDFVEFVNNVALQIASMSPQFVHRDEIGEADKDKQRDIFRGQIAEEQKQTGKTRPPEAIEKIIEGKLNKWMTEICLVDQPSIMESDKTVQKTLEELTAKIGEKLSIRRFVRFELGEGIEKKTEDFAAEVAKTMKSV